MPFSFLIAWRDLAPNANEIAFIVSPRLADLAQNAHEMAFSFLRAWDNIA